MTNNERLKEIIKFFMNDGTNITNDDVSFLTIFAGDNIGVVSNTYGSTDEIITMLMIMIDGVYKELGEELHTKTREDFIKMISTFYMLAMDVGGFGDKGDKSGITIKMPRKFFDKD
jgi:hypothetical protein